jgi:hypothetical protein
VGDHPFVFEGDRPRRGLSNTALLMLLRRLKVGAHGFRSAFRSWCADTGRRSPTSRRRHGAPKPPLPACASRPSRCADTPRPPTTTSERGRPRRDGDADHPAVLNVRRLRGEPAAVFIWLSDQPPTSCARELFFALDCRTPLASAARLATERRACIPGRRVSSVQHGNAAMPLPPATGDLASALAP